jgi:hypothetical protein
MVIFSAQSPPRYFLITHGRRQKVIEGSGAVRDKKQGESRCHNITLLQDCDISGAYPKAVAMKIMLSDKARNNILMLHHLTSNLLPSERGRNGEGDLDSTDPWRPPIGR